MAWRRSSPTSDQPYRPTNRFFQPALAPRSAHVPRRRLAELPPWASRRQQFTGIQLVQVDGIPVAPVMVPYVHALQAYARRLGCEVILTSGYRTARQQSQLRVRWLHGDPTVIFPPAAHSYHEYGLAVDLESRCLESLGRYAEGIGMRWGGRYGDPVHFDLGRRT